MEPIEVFVLMMCTAIIWFVAWLVLHHKVNETANSPELRQCLSQSGTTWLWGECIIILNK